MDHPVPVYHPTQPRYTGCAALLLLCAVGVGGYYGYRWCFATDPPWHEGRWVSPEGATPALELGRTDGRITLPLTGGYLASYPILYWVIGPDRVVFAEAATRPDEKEARTYLMVREPHGAALYQLKDLGAAQKAAGYGAVIPADPEQEHVFLARLRNGKIEQGVK